MTFKCIECGKEVWSNQLHTFEDCMSFKNMIQCSKCNGKGWVFKSTESVPPKRTPNQNYNSPQKTVHHSDGKKLSKVDSGDIHSQIKQEIDKDYAKTNKEVRT